ncbi:MAG: cation:H+ antiporter [Candidatus Endobugula sp.]|jgi:cation:H+ antiporter
MTNTLPWLAVLAGFAGLIWSADRFIDGSAAIANNFGISKLLIGLTVVAFGTSAPEIVVSISASLRGAGEIAIGNAIGSNLANIGLVLGITTLVAPLTFKSYMLRQEVPIMLAVMGVAGWFLYNGELSRTEGVLLVSLMIPLLAWLIYSKKQHPEEEEDIAQMSMLSAGLWFGIGLALLVTSAEILVWGASSIAKGFGISPLIIGLTVVAVGTSLPELAASVISTLKGHYDIAIGNVIGSNIFNLLLVAGIPAIIQPLSMTSDVFYRDYFYMMALTTALCGLMLFALLIKKNSTLGRRSGALLLTLYVGYYVLLMSTH